MIGAAENAAALPIGSLEMPDARSGEPITLAASLKADAGWTDADFGQAGLNPPYLRVGGKLRVTLTEYEPCFASVRRHHVLFRSKVPIAEHLERYATLMVDPLAFEECFGVGEGTQDKFPFGAWLTPRRVTFEGLELWGRRQGEVQLPLDALTIASAIWLKPHDVDADCPDASQRLPLQAATRGILRGDRVTRA